MIWYTCTKCQTILNLSEKFHVMGIKINTPHYLAKLENVQRGASFYTIIVSQLESLSTIYYTLRVSFIFIHVQYVTSLFMYMHVHTLYIHIRGSYKQLMSFLYAQTLKSMYLHMYTYKSTLITCYIRNLNFWELSLRWILSRFFSIL